MSELKQYIDKNLDKYFEFNKALSETAVNKIFLYKHKNSGKSLCLIESNYRNDDVFRILKSANTKGVLPQIYEVASEDDKVIILEEYIEGVTLSSVIANRKISQNEIKKCILDICDALNILHTNNIIHRDIKPENIIIKDNGNACLIDLSIAKIMTDAKTKDTINLGTIGYAAPEQFGFSQSQPTTDIYALGVMINELILGVHPSINVPKGTWGKVIKKCTATQISKRYQSINDVIKAINKVRI